MGLIVEIFKGTLISFVLYALVIDLSLEPTLFEDFFSKLPFDLVL